MLISVCHGGLYLDVKFNLAELGPQNLEKVAGSAHAMTHAAALLESKTLHMWHLHFWCDSHLFNLPL